MLNGNLLVRKGGGCMDLLVALGKLPVSGKTNHSPDSSRNTSSTIDPSSLVLRNLGAGADVDTSSLVKFGLGSLAVSPTAQLSLSLAAAGPDGSPDSLLKGLVRNSHTSHISGA